jgi:hypothetical protein
MKTTMRSGFLAVGVLVGVIFGAQLVSAQTFGFPVAGFTTSNVCSNSATPPPACQVLTNGFPFQPTVVTGGVLRLTTANINQHGAAWYYLPQPLSTGFTTAFQFQISSTNSCFFCTFPADGLALVIQNDPAGTGAIGYTGNGQNMSYGNNDISTASGPGNAILNSLAVELDTHQNTNYDDPDGNHIAVQSCGPNNSSTLTPNSADHNYTCPNGSLAKIALESLPSGLSLTDGKTHTITVNYLPPGTCTSGCNNFSVYMDSTLILQTTVNLATQLNLTSDGSAYIGFTAATGSLVENNDIISWSFSSLPLAPITINQPLQPTQTIFNYTPTLSAVSDYSQSGLGGGSFTGVFMQGTVQTITDNGPGSQFYNLVENTPFQGSTCQHQDTGSGNYGCVITTDLCTTSTSGTASGANCPNTGTNAAINVSNTYNIDPSQKPIINPGYIMGKDNALSCGASGDNTCKGLVNIFTGISGDIVTSNGHTDNFNSTLIPILGVVQPSTAATTSPQLNQGWTNASVTLTLNSTDIVPSNNTNPPATLPTVTSITYSTTGANLPSPASGTITGQTGSIVIPNTAQGATVVTFYGTDSAGTIESTTTNTGNQVSSVSPTFTIQVDTIPPTVSCTSPAPMWQFADVIVPCTASDNAGGSGLAGPASFNVATSVPAGTETTSATISAVTVQDIAGNTSTPQGPFGPFEVDKKPPVINGPTISPSSPTYGQTITASYSCTDGGSGVVLCGPPGSANIPTTGNTGTLTLTASGAVGMHTVTINAQDAVGNPSTPSSLTYTVAQATPTVTFTGAPASAAFGSTFTVSATTNASTTAVISASGACSIAGNLVTMNSGTGTCSLTATWAADSNYLGVTKSQSTTATKATTILSWPNPAPIPYGTALSSTQLDAAANVPGTFVYSPSAGTVLAAGTQTLSVTFTPTASLNYTSATAQVTLLVTQPAISISPSSINFGTVKSGRTATQNVTVSSVGNAPLNITGVSIKCGSSCDSDDFTFKSSCGASLATGSSCNIAVTFNADDSGTRSATLNITDNAPGSPQGVALTGTSSKKGH